MPREDAVPAVGIRLTLSPVKSASGRIQYWHLRVAGGRMTYSRKIGYLGDLSRADVVLLMGAVQSEMESWLPF